jgi:pyrophosphatase PpaX
MPTALLFDLDGTVADSIELILASARHAFIGFDGNAPNDEEWRVGIGRPLLAVLREYAGGNEDEAQRLLARYRDFQLEHHDQLLRPYPQMEETLRELRGSGYVLGIVTSKSDWLASRALEFLKLNDLFSVLVGCDTCVNHKPHPEPVERALTLLGIPNSAAIYVGDSPHDILCGRAAGVGTIGVTWGAFAREELEANGADVVIDVVTELTGTAERILIPDKGLQTF